MATIKNQKIKKSQQPDFTSFNINVSHQEGEYIFRLMTGITTTIVALYRNGKWQGYWDVDAPFQGTVYWENNKIYLSKNFLVLLCDLKFFRFLKEPTFNLISLDEIRSMKAELSNDPTQRFIVLDDGDILMPEREVSYIDEFGQGRITYSIPAEQLSTTAAILGVLNIGGGQTWRRDLG